MPPSPILASKQFVGAREANLPIWESGLKKCLGRKRRSRSFRPGWIGTVGVSVFPMDLEGEVRGAA